MPSMTYPLLFTLFIVFAELVSSELTVKPTDTEVMVGHLVTLKCSTSNPNVGVKWNHIPVGREISDKSIIYGNGAVYPPYRDRLHVQRNFTTNAHNLMIPAALVEDAGRYQCEDEEGAGNKSLARLIVLTSPLECTSDIESYEVIGPNSCNAEPETLNLSCTVSYYGPTHPLITWTKSGDDNRVLDSVSQVYKDNETVATLSLKADPAMNGASYICKALRSTDPKDSCTSKPIKIIYAFNNFSLVEKSVGDKFRCSAHSSQSCTYRWLKDGAVVEGKSDQVHLKDAGLYVCHAKCRVKENDYEVVAAVVHVNTVASSSPGVWILLVLLILTIAISVGLLVYLYCSRRRILKLAVPSQDEEATAALRPLMAAQDAEVKKLNSELEAANKEIQTQKEQVVKLNKRQKELGKLLYQPRPENVDYVMKTAGPITTKTTVKEMRPIKGLAIIDKELFIASQKSLEVEVYDSTTFKYCRGWALVGLIDAEDLASCVRNKSLYFSDQKLKDSDTKEIIRVDPNGNIMTKWETGLTSGRLSVSEDGHVLLTVFSTNVINEYSPEGALIRSLDLSSSGITNPLHSLKLKSGHFLVSHGLGDDPIHRVCIVDVDGEIIKSFGKKKGSAIGQMQGPICLAVDAEDSIIVADCNNSRLLLLNSVLEYRRILESEESLFQYPVRICLNQSNGRMFVADLQSANHRLTVFDLDKPSLPDPVYARH